VKSYEILKVRNALVKSVYYVTAYNIIILSKKWVKKNIWETEMNKRGILERLR